MDDQDAHKWLFGIVSILVGCVCREARSPYTVSSVMAIVITKRPIVDFFSEHEPEFNFIAEKRPNLIFQHVLANGLNHFIAVQRDGPGNGLSIQVAATYNPQWQGEPAYPLGIDAGLANPRLRSRCIEAIEHWHFYEPTVDGLQRTLIDIHQQYITLTPSFFAHADRQLLSNKLLQLAITESRNIPESDRAGLREAIDDVNNLVDRLEHPAFVRLRDKLRAAWSWRTSKEQRIGTNRLAYDALVFTRP